MTDASDKPVNDDLDMIFRLYDAPTGGFVLWTETYTGTNAVPVENGLFHVMLGSLTPIDTSMWITNTLYLGVQVGSDPEMTPREVVGTVPYAIIAGSAYALDAPDGDPQNALFVDNDGNVGIGTTEPGNQLHISIGVDIGAARNANSSKAGLNTQKASSTNIQLTGRTWGGSHGILFNAYKKSDQIDGNLFTTGNTAYANDAGTNRGGAGAIGFFGNGGVMNFYISPESTGEDTDIDWGTPQMRIERGGDVGIGTTNPTERLHVVGNIQATGTKSAIVNTDSYGQRKLYAFEQASNRFADEGRASLVNGSARVDVDPIFLETIEKDFLIHITPYGNASLYVAEIGETYFVIRARDGDPSIPFAWYLSASRKDYAEVRLELVEDEIANEEGVE